MTAAPTYKKKDFMSDQVVRWCPGCGDYSILSQVQTTFAGLGVLRENFAVISGIGCSSRFPYYMETYGFHTIHGRAPTFASGLKATRPDLSVWVISGDGDMLSIGGNHIIHALRRNFDINVLLFNNQIYGLTKGQYSPTSEVGKKTKSTPYGSIDEPFNPITLALGAGGTFIARSLDVHAKHLQSMLVASHDHKGTGLVEIYQNCNIFNDGAFDTFRGKAEREENALFLENGQPMIFGKTTKMGLVLDHTTMKVVEIGDEYGEEDCVVHDEGNFIQAQLLAQLKAPDFPVPLGIIYRCERPTYEQSFQDQVSEARAKLGNGVLAELVKGGDTWRVEG
ncbi:MAG: 2-oxoacid:ferredoxin oxidoreductase subunit beta [Proteobacteria bacterium]|nr:2-oxoacid:ferredoxin oxidoreductase subunit beta [Pseudomonadota bacterium]